jgi:hypothetical protein
VQIATTQKIPKYASIAVARYELIFSDITLVAGQSEPPINLNRQP